MARRKDLRLDRKKGKGLDVGTSFVYCAEKQGNKIVFRTERDAFFDLEPSDFTKRMLGKAGVNYIQRDDQLFIVGDEALGFANIFNQEARRPLSRGVISAHEKEALPMTELLIKSVTGPPKYQGEIVYYSVPGEPVDSELNITYHQNILGSFLTRWGYTPKPIGEGLAVVYAELEKEGFTGIGISFGGGMINVCLSYMAVPIFTFSITKSGDWVDQQVAQAVDETATRICTIKEASFDLTKRDGLSKIETALSIYYDNLIEYALEHIKRRLQRAKEMPKIDRAITVVLAGGTALPKGFLARFKRLLERVSLPIEVGEVRKAREPMHAVCKGALISALTDEERK